MTRSKQPKKPKSSLRYLSQIPIKPDNFKDLFDELDGGSDRACAIVGSTIIEHGLIDLITTVMIVGRSDDDQVSKDFVDIFFEINSPLGTMSAKASIANALGLFDNNYVKGDIDIVRRIRNVFAHRVHHIDFDNSVVDAEMQKMNISYCSNQRDDTFFSFSKRQQFVFCVMEIYFYLRECRLEIMQRQHEILKCPIHLRARGASFYAPVNTEK